MVSCFHLREAMLGLIMRILFMGSPQFSVPSLRDLASYYNLIGVITQPDRPAGRGKTLRPSPVKIAAQDLSLNILQPRRIKDDDSIAQIENLKPDLIVVVAYGQILPKDILDIPTHGCLNIHASLLPRWRGAAPIHAAILHGDEETGISIMLMDVGLDTGPVISQTKVTIQAHETTGDLSDRLSVVGAELIIKILPGYLKGEITPIPQDESMVTYAPLIRKSEGALDFNKTSDQLSLQIRAFEPWPTSYFYWDDQRIVVKKARSLSGKIIEKGRVILIDPYPAITTEDGILVLEEIQPAGRKVMPGDAFLRGSPEFIGANLSVYAN
jgi:methionyl-tRNA formyltransferase